MMKKKLTNIVLFSILIIFFISCNDFTKSEMTSNNKIVFDLTKAIDLGLKDAMNLEKKTIELSFSDSIAIPAYSSLLINEDNFILFSQKTFQIFRFDTVGNFMNFIGRRGGGPSEYIEMRDVTLNKLNNNLIEILDIESILKYQLDGTFIKKTKIKYPAFSFDFDNNNYWFFIGNNPTFSQYKLVQTDTNFIQKNEYLKIHEKGVPLVENNFSKGSHITYRESLNPNLYVLDDELNHSYYIDFGKFTVSEDILFSDPTLMIEKLGNIEYATTRTYLENENFTFLLIMKYEPNKMFPDLYYWIIDKNTKKEKLIHINDFIEESYLLYPQTLSNNDYIYFLGYNIASMDEQIDPNSNPNIIKIQIEELLNFQ